MKFAALIMAGVLSLYAADNDRKNDSVKRIQAATTTLIDIQHSKDGGIPQSLLQRARCVGIIPATKKGAFILGGQYGKGIVTCRINDSNRWSAPAMMVLEAGSVGWQAGGVETDIIFTVMNRHAQERIATQKVVLGAGITGAAGPVGRNIGANTNLWMRNEMLTWSRSHGVFAGIDLKGGSLRINRADNAAMYGPNVSAMEILDGRVPPPPEAHALYVELARYAQRVPKTGE